MKETANRKKEKIPINLVLLAVVTLTTTIIGISANAGEPEAISDTGGDPPDYISPEPLKIWVDDDTLSTGLFVKQSDQLVVWLTNDRKEDGFVEFYASAGSHKQIVEQHLVATTGITGGETKVAYIPIDTFKLSYEPLHFSGGVTIEGRIHYFGGAENCSNEPIDFYFHPEGGGWWIYNKKALNELFDGGYLTAEAKALRDELKKKAESAGEKFYGGGYSYGEGTAAEPKGGKSLLLSESVRFCFKHSGAYTDNNFTNDQGYTEDYFLDDNAKYAKGQKVQVVKNSVTIFEDYLGDGLGAASEGCTSYITVADVNGTYTYTLGSYGYVNSNTIDVKDYTGNARVSYTTNIVLSGVSATQYTYTTTIPKATLENGDIFYEFNAYQTAAYALYRFNGGVTGQTYTFKVGASENKNNGSNIELTNSGAERKFTTAHELGHRLGYYGTSQHLSTGSNYHWNDDNPPCETEESPYLHQLNSREYNGAGLSEGFANFYAVIAFNDTSSTTCTFKYYKTITNAQGTSDENPTINCNTGNSNYPDEYMENECFLDGDPWAGDGMELDWMRMWWDFLTGAGTQPTFTQIVTILNNADQWDEDTAYTEVTEEVGQYQSGTFSTRWSNVTQANGVNH